MMVMMLMKIKLIIIVMIVIDDDNDCNHEKYDDDVVDSYDYDGINDYYIIYTYIFL